MGIDEKTRHAIKHTMHCLVGCGVGEIVGMVVAAWFGWYRLERVSIAVVLAFAFGYSLTYRGVRRQTKTAAEAMRVTTATDTASIVSMEIVDNFIEFLIPNALIVTATSPRFWWGLAVSLSVALIITVPINRFMMGKSPHAMHH